MGPPGLRTLRRSALWRRRCGGCNSCDVTGIGSPCAPPRGRCSSTTTATTFVPACLKLAGRLTNDIEPAGVGCGGQGSGERNLVASLEGRPPRLPCGVGAGLGFLAATGNLGRGRRNRLESRRVQMARGQGVGVGRTSNSSWYRVAVASTVGRGRLLDRPGGPEISGTRCGIPTWPFEARPGRSLPMFLDESAVWGALWLQLSRVSKPSVTPVFRVAIDRRPPAISSSPREWAGTGPLRHRTRLGVAVDGSEGPAGQALRCTSFQRVEAAVMALVRPVSK